MRPDIDESLPSFMRWESVASLVGSRRTESIVAYPEKEADCREAIAFCKRNGLSICVRGGGYSYGDIILNDQNVLVSIVRMDRILDFKQSSGHITVEPGVKIIDIFERVHHLRFALGGCPSESTITVAGAIAANVNGKDAWRLGNFGDQVVSIKLLTASGEILHLDRAGNETLFRAVIGGMGLLGIIVQATLRLQKIPSPFLEISRTPVINVRDLLDHLTIVEARCDFAVVWLDTCAKGAKLGRAVIHATNWVKRASTPDELKAQVTLSRTRLEARRRQTQRLHWSTEFVVAVMMQFQRTSVRWFNRLYFYYSKFRLRMNSANNVESFIRYNFDASFMIPSATAVCGPLGYTLQVSFPRSEALAAITEMIELCHASPCLPAKLIMRLHRRDDYLISFSEDGYSLNFEFHPKKRHQERMRLVVDKIIECIIRVGGKVHLAKDMVLTRDQFQRLFPLYRAFLEVKQSVDPESLFQSDMYRRLIRVDVNPAAGLTEHGGQADEASPFTSTA